MNVAVVIRGEPESDLSVLNLAKLVIGSGAEIVAVPLSSNRMELFKSGKEGELWRLN